MTSVIPEVSERTLVESPGVMPVDTPAGSPGGRAQPWGAGLRRVASFASRALVVLGVLVLVFFGFQLWGTGVLERQAQQGLGAELERAIADHQEQLATLGAHVLVRDEEVVSGGRRPLGMEVKPSAAIAAGDSEAADSVTVPLRSRPEPGSAVARIEAPAIGLDKTVVEGVGRPQLRDGPGLYPVSPLPGHSGNVAIAGHRTTHGSPFADLDQLVPGDPITLETVDGVFTYRVEAQYESDGVVVGHRIVSPDAVEVIADRGDNRLTLTSCHPRYSDRQRLIVTAVLEGSAVAFPEPAASPGGLATAVDRPDLGSGLAGSPIGRAVEGRSDGFSEPATGLDEPLGWQLDRLGGAALWAFVLLVALVPPVVLFRHQRRILAMTLLPFTLLYPLVALLTTIDAMAPAW